MRNILFLIPPKVHLLDINGPAHIFYEAKEYGAAIKLHFITINNETEIESSAGLNFSKLVPFESFDLTQDDFVFVPGLEFQLLSKRSFIKKSKPFLNWLNQQNKNGAMICSVCTGTFLLAEAGVLNGKSCTTHWKYFKDFSEKYPQIDLKNNRLFVTNNNVYTSAGVASGIDLSLYLLETHFDSKLASDVAKEVVVYFRRGESDPQLSIFLQYRNHLDTRIHDAQNFMMGNIPTGFNLEDIAKSVNMSSRNLTRLFKKNTGITIGDYLEKLRVENAVQLFSEGNKVEFVAKECGLKSTNQLRSLLKKHRGILPTDIFTV